MGAAVKGILIVSKPNVRARLLASSMICGVAVATAGPALAQTGGTAEEVEEIVVTGSRIPSPNLESVSPVTTVGAQDIAMRGVTRTEDLVNQLPQVFAAQGAMLANGATGTATVDLRGLGANRTLVLVDGRRLHIGTPSGNPGNTAPDLNFIPASLIERVEVVTGGASAVYGADAVAGVVNFIMQKNFEGVRLDAQYSTYQHTNNNSDVREALRRRAAVSLYPDQFAAPDKNVWDGAVTDINMAMGANLADGKGNVTAYAGYRNAKKLLQNQRDFSACNLGTSTNAISFAGFACGGSGTTAPAMFIPGGGTGSQLTLDPAAAGGRGFRAYNGNRDAFNFAPYNDYQRPDTRYTLGAFGTYEVSPAAEMYAQLMFMDDHTSATIAPSGIFGANMNINCAGNPFLTAAMVTAFCAPTIDQLPDDPNFPGTLGVNADADPTTPGQQASVAVLRRNVEGGGRISDLRHTSYRGVVGMRGELGNGFRYDVYGLYGTVEYQQVFNNDFSLTRSARALDVVTDPATGRPACRSAVPSLAGSNADANCVPYDIFSLTPASPQALAYLQTPGFQNGEYVQQVVSASITGDLGQYGVKFPWANDGIGFALGAEYRRERLDLNTDTAFQSGDLAGQGGATMPTEGTYDLFEVFGEARIPIVQDQPFFHSLTAEVGYRFSDYSLGFSTDTYKISGDWAPTADFRIRGGLNRAVRAPNIVELFATNVIGNNGNVDPCEGPVAQLNLTAAQCARTGVTAAQYGNIVPNLAAQYNGQTGGNPNLDPETSDTLSFGVVFTPTFFPGFSLSADWFNIEVTDLIGNIGQDETLQRCAETGDAFFCGLIHRAPGTGSLWLSPNGFVVDTTFNTGGLEVEGVDFEANYRFNFSDFGATSALADYGGLSINFQGSFLDKYLVTTLPGDEPFDCAGLFGSICTNGSAPAAAPLPEWRHKVRATWRTPWNVEVSGTWRHIASVDVDSEFSGASHAAGPDAKLGAQDYFDLAGTWAIRENMTLRFGVNNIFDREPPLVSSGGATVSNCPSGPCSGNTFPQTYDALGRYLFVGLRADF